MALLAAGTLAFGCSSSSAGPAKTAKTGERNTELVHEPCDVTSSSAKKVDVNGDGKPDIIHVMNGSREVCRVVDLNFDGAVDAYIYYDEQGKERRRESDFDRDGRADEITILKDGVVIRKERETNFDNKIDTWDYYENDRLVRRERDSDGDGIVDQWWQFNNPTNPKCAVVATDRNADRKPDPDSVVDLCGESYGAPKASPTGSSSSHDGAAGGPKPQPASAGSNAPTAGSAAAKTASSSSSPPAAATTPTPSPASSAAPKGSVATPSPSAAPAASSSAPPGAKK